MVRRLREAGAIVVGLTLLPGAGDLRLHRVGDLRRDPQSLEPAAHPRRLERRLRRRGRRRPGPDRLGRRRRRLDPHPGGLLRPLRPQADAGPRLAGAQAGRAGPASRSHGCVSRTVLDTALWLDVVAGGSKEPEAPPPPERPFVESAKAAPGKLRVAWSTAAPRAAAPPHTVSDEVKRRVADAAELLGSLGHDVVQQDPDWGRIGNNITAALPARRRRDASTRSRTPSDSNGAPAASAGSAACLPDALSSSRRDARPRRRRAPGSTRSSTHYDVLMTPVMGGTALPVRRWEGRGALRTVLGMSRFYPYCVPWNHLGNPAMAVPFGFGADGMPLSVQVVGRPGDEATLLSLAAQIEAERPWADQRPPALPVGSGKTLRIRSSSRTLPRGRILPRSIDLTGLSPGRVESTQSAQLVSKVTFALGASPGSARVEPLSTIRCQGSASLKRHW